MKKYALLVFLMTMSSFSSANNCYFYVTSNAQADFEVHRGEGLKIIFSNIVSDDCDGGVGVSTDIALQFQEALKEKYPDTAMYTARNPNVWGPYPTYGEVGREIRAEKARYKGDGWKIINVHFANY